MMADLHCTLFRTRVAWQGAAGGQASAVIVSYQHPVAGQPAPATTRHHSDPHHKGSKIKMM